MGSRFSLTDHGIRKVSPSIPKKVEQAGPSKEVIEIVEDEETEEESVTAPPQIKVS